MFADCKGVPYPEFGIGFVSGLEEVKGAVPEGSVYLLKIVSKQLPAAGQFFMLHPQRSNHLLSRPISVFHVENLGDGSNEIFFMILLKGKGTHELCNLQINDKVNLLGPCGNKFESPAEAGKKVLIIGGGIGVAPVAGFAETLAEKSYDFIASFKSGSYGLDFVKPEKLVITTDDGSVGVHGMLSAALTKEFLQDGNYSAVYACGPTPMLAYIQSVCKETGTKSYLSMEAHMACGVGVCLGCTIDTTEGKKRCCKDGPVFDGNILIFERKDSVGGFKVQPRRDPLVEDEAPDMSFTLKGVRFENPIIGSSGTFGFGTEYKSVFDVNRLGGISSKGLTLEPRQGNDGMRLWETPSGLMNSIGLQNPGIPHFIEHELPEMMALKPVAIANLSGSTMESYVEGAKLLDKSDVPVIELNISCPNVSAGGASWGMSCSAAEQIVKAVRAATIKPLIVKLTPQAPDLAGVALKCIESGADAISLCNSFQGIAVDIERGVPVFEKVKAGVGGPAVRPIAVRLVYEMAQAIKTLPAEKQVPLIAIGGAATWEDVVEFIMVGADAVQVGTATFANPFAMVEMIDGLNAFMKRKGYKSIKDMQVMK